MRIKGTVKIRFHEDSVSRNLDLWVRFKLPHQYFYRNKRYVLLNSFSKSIINGNFEKEALQIVNDKKYLEDKAKNVITDYIDGLKSKKNKLHMYKELNRRVNEINSGNFEIEIDYE